MWVCERQSRNPHTTRRTYLIGVLGAILGAKFWYGLQYGNFFPGGLSFYGFGLGGLLAVALYHRWSQGRWAASDFPDAAATAVAAGVIFQRAGCFLQGCCFGEVCEYPWSVQFPAGSPAYSQQLAAGLISPGTAQSLPVHPTQIYEMMAAAVALVLMFAGRRHSERIPLLRYELFLGGSIYYSLYRFLTEYLRADSGGIHFGPLTFAQATAVVGSLPAAYFLITRRIRYARGEKHLIMPALKQSVS